MDASYQEWLSRMQAEHELWQRKVRRSQIIARWFLIPYVIAGGAAGCGIGLASDYSRNLGLLLGCAFTVLVAAQWTQPYLTRRLNRKDSISRTTGPDAVNVEPSATSE